MLVTKGKNYLNVQLGKSAKLRLNKALTYTIVYVPFPMICMETNTAALRATASLFHSL